MHSLRSFMSVPAGIAARVRQAGSVRRSALLAAMSAAGLVGGIAVTGSQAAQASGSFNCGPHATTYAVTSLSNHNFGGVRCVEFPDHGDRLSFAWYGEGSWGGTTYRNIGKATASGDGVTATASSADLYGGDTRNVFNDTIQMRVRAWDNGQPSEIDVTGAWYEHWSATPSVNYTPLPKVYVCGDNVDQYLVTPVSRPSEVDGIRCVLEIGPNRDTVWYGQGHWGTWNYTHVGIWYAGRGYGESSDLCGSAFGEFCNHTTSYGLSFTPFGDSLTQGYTVGGNWNERWQLS